MLGLKQIESQPVHHFSFQTDISKIVVVFITWLHNVESVVVLMSEESDNKYLAEEVKKLQDRVNDQNKILMVLTIIVIFIAMLDFGISPWFISIAIMILIVVLVAIAASLLEKNGF